MDSIIYFLPMLLFLGIVTSYEDIKKNRIRNKWVIVGLIYAALVNIFLILINKIDLTYLYYMLINGLICLFIGLVLWYVSFWTAGDAKLFFTYSLLIPLNYYAAGFIKYSPSITILINLFFVVVLYLGFAMLSKVKKERIIRIIKNRYQIKDSICSLFFIFGLTWAVSSALGIFNIRDILISFVLSLFAFMAARRLLGEFILESGLVLTLLRFVFDKNIFSLHTLLLATYVFLFWLVFMKILFELSDFTFAGKVRIKNLKEGMILARTVEGRSKSRMFFIKSGSCLSKKDIRRLKLISMPEKLDYVSIRQTAAFAPFLFIGVIITILAKGNILIVLKNLI